ncbi:hypothetical protein [Vreelandella sp. EE22]
MLPNPTLNTDPAPGVQAKDPARRALLKAATLGVGGAFLTGTPWTHALATPDNAPVIKHGWLLSITDLDGSRR